MPKKTDPMTELLLKAAASKNFDAASDEALGSAIRELDTLLDARPRRQRRSRLEVLTEAIHAYESVRYPSEPVADKDMLKFLIDNRPGLTQVQLSHDTGISESTISSVLRGKRKLTRAQIGTLCRYFHVEPGVFTW